MENQDLDELNKKIKEQFDKITKNFNNLFEIKKISEEIEIHVIFRNFLT